MNGARSTFMRKGYWLTALAAAVLLTASPGTVSAQDIEADPSFDSNGLKVEVAKVAEGDTTTITVSVKATVTPETDATNDTAADRTVMVTVTAEEYDDQDGAAYDATKLVEGTDYAFNPSTANMKSIVFPADTEGESVVKTATFTLYTNADPDAEDEDIKISVTVAHAGGGGFTSIGDGDEPAKKLTIEDAQTQTYVLTLSSSSAKAEEGDDVTVSIKADPAHVNGSGTLTLNLDRPAPDYTVTPAEVTLNLEGNESEMDLTVTTKAVDGNRVTDTVTLTAYSGRAGAAILEDSLAIKLTDKNELPAVAMMVVDDMGKALDPQPTSVPEGESVMVMVMSVDEEGDATPALEELKVALMPTGTADSADYTVIGSSDIGMDDTMSDVINIEVRSDEDVGMESLMFDAVVSGESANGPGTRTSAAVLSLYIEDATAKKIEPKASPADYAALMAAIAAGGGDDGVNPGDTVTLMTSDLFDLMDGYTASYGVSVEGDSASASASGESVTINALMAGEAKITVTGTARMTSSSLVPSQTVSNVAELTFPVMVVDTTLVLTLSAEPMEIAEGGTSTITATASRAVTVDDGAVAIDLTVVGDGELDDDSIMIAMGDMSGSAMLTATEDDEDFEDETVTVVATGSGIDGTMQVAVAVTDNDEAPAIPNQISAKPQDEAYPVITAAIAAGAGDDEMLTPGESVELMASDLFMVMDGYTASYRVSVDGTAVSGSASGDSISVMAGAAGEAKVTVTGVAKMAVSSFEASQDATNVASITFPVTVEAEAEPVPEPVPALPLIAQWLLGLGLLGGGARQLFRRRRQG